MLRPLTLQQALAAYFAVVAILALITVYIQYRNTKG